jgi:regulator of telomere elongation helicase 1
MVQSSIYLRHPLPTNTFPIQLDDIKTPIYFPKAPYPQQVAFVKSMAEAIINGSNALLESPTGTGKTLSILATSIGLLYHNQQTEIPSTAAILGASVEIKNTERRGELRLEPMQEPLTAEGLRAELSRRQHEQQLGRAPAIGLSELIDATRKSGGGTTTTGATSGRKGRVYYGSRTHSQLQQLLVELRSIPYIVTSTVLASRDRLCVLQDVQSSPPGEIAKKCGDAVKAGSCKYYSNYRHNTGNMKNTLKDMAGKIMDVEELYTYGKSMCICPYYASKDMIPLSHIVFLPYNYLTDEDLQLSEEHMEGAVVVFDEAHNAGASFEEGASCTIDNSVLSRALDEVKTIERQDIALGRTEKAFACSRVTEHLKKIM